MRQLTALDAQFLNFERSTTVTHVGGLAIIDQETAPGGRITLDDLRELVERRLHLVDPLRWRLVEVPFGLDYPYWIEDAEFDVEYHVREIALPSPGTEEQLGEQVARLAARPLDRRRPLWEIYLIHGLEGGRAATYAKIHHAAIDGVTGTELLGALLDLSPEQREIPAPEDPRAPEQPPTPLELLGAGLVRMAAHPVRTARALPKAIPGLMELPGVSTALRGLLGTDQRSGGEAPADGPVSYVPSTPFTGKITPHRRLAFGSLPLDEVKRVKNAFSLTVNDVVMTLCAAAVRRWLVDHDALPEYPLVAAVPISVRAEDREAADGNQISVMVAPIPTHLAEPGERLAATAQSMSVAKRRYGAVPATWLQEFSSMLPGALGAMAARAVGAFAGFADNSLMNLIISNVPGPQVPLYMAGGRVVAHYPVSAISDATGGMNITVMSYDGRLDFGIVVCREMVPDVWNLIGYLRDALDELLNLAAKQP